MFIQLSERSLLDCFQSSAALSCPWHQCLRVIQIDVFFQNSTINKTLPETDPCILSCRHYHLQGLMTINGIVVFFVPLHLIVSFIDFQGVYSKTTRQLRIAGLTANGWLEKLSIDFPSCVWHVSMLPRSIWTRQTQNLMTASLVKLTLFKLICGYAYLSLELFILGYLRL